jgi:NAD(P)-dependent dehydrogenase (short-subunit alcohol dehydrogenase family)
MQALQCRLHALDLRSPEAITAFAAQLVDKPIDVLLNVAGIMVPTQQDQLDTVKPEALAQIFQVNTFAPLLLTQALLPNLFAKPGSVIGIVSSRVGSIGDNSTGGTYAYRSSKAAVNSIGKSMAMDLKEKGIVVCLLHPGFTKTNINTGHEHHPESVEPQEAASKLWQVMMSKSIEDTGKFWHREGYELPW